MKIKLRTIFIAILFLSSCKNSSTKFGEASYYPSFLWSDAQRTYAEKTIVLDFSIDALHDHSFATIEFTDENGDRIDSDIFELYVDSIKKQSGFQIIANPKNNPQEIKVKIGFNPNVSSGKYKGLLKLKRNGHNLDRIDETILQNGDEACILKWEVKYLKYMNPLAKAVLFTLGIVIFSFLIWMLILKRRCFPIFSDFKKVIRVEGQFQKNVNFKGNREVIFTNNQMKIPAFENFFKGNKLYVLHSSFESPIVIKPYKRKKAIIQSNNTYRIITQNPFDKNGITEIINVKNHNKIILN
jgi:hypothetical protein